MLPATPGQSRPHRAQGVQYLLGSKWVNFWQLKATETQAMQALNAVPRYMCWQMRGMPWALPLSPTQKWWHTGWAQLHTRVGRGSGTWVFGHRQLLPVTEWEKAVSQRWCYFIYHPAAATISRYLPEGGREGKVGSTPSRFEDSENSRHTAACQSRLYFKQSRLRLKRLLLYYF